MVPVNLQKGSFIHFQAPQHQQKELININCNINGCKCKNGYKKLQLIESSNYLIIHLKRFKGTQLLKNHKNIFINDRIVIENSLIGKKYYSLIGIFHHLGYNMNMDIIFVKH